MPEPLAVCLEDQDAPSEAPRYLRCVAVVGRQPGLRLDAAGAVLWRDDADVACELWVSGDDQLILYRPDGAAGATVRRAGREVVAPVGKPVVLRDQDEVDVGPRRLRVHVHGPAPEVAAPAPLEVAAPSPLPEPAQRSSGAVTRAAAALALGAALGAGGCVEVRQRPPDMASPPQPRDAAPSPAGPPPATGPTGILRILTQADGGVAAKPGTPTAPGPIEVRPAPPAVMPPPPPPAPPPPPTTKPGSPATPAPAPPAPRPAPKPDSK
jgi:hypothetical protein